MTELDTASPHHTDAPRECQSKQSARGAGFTRCPRQAQQQAAARAIQRSIEVPLASTGSRPVPKVERRAVQRRATSVVIIASIAAATGVAFIRWPHLGDSITRDIRQLNGVWVAPAIALAGISMLTAALEQRRVLLAGGLSLPARSMFAITLAGNAVSVTVPLAGSTAGTAFTFIQLKKRGADVATAAWALATSGIISTTVLAFVLGGRRRHGRRRDVSRRSRGGTARHRPDRCAVDLVPVADRASPRRARRRTDHRAAASHQASCEQ